VTVEDEGTMMDRYVRNHSPNSRVSHS